MPYLSAEVPGISIRNCWFPSIGKPGSWADVINDGLRSDEADIAESTAPKGNVGDRDCAADGVIGNDENFRRVSIEPAVLDDVSRANQHEDGRADDIAVDVGHAVDS